MATRVCDYHYLVTSEPQDLIKYATRVDALTAMHNLMHRHAEEGYKTERQRDGRYLSTHPDGRSIQLWIEDSNGAVIA